MGRRFGDKNIGTIRKENAARQRAFRAKKKEKAELEEDTELEYQKILKRQKEQNLIFFGEIAPCQNCQTAQEELEAASLFAAAMQIEPKQANETVRTFIDRTLRRWCEIGTPLLCLTTGTFAEPVLEPDPKRFDDLKEFASKYEFPDGVDEHLDENRTAENVVGQEECQEIVMEETQNA